jgi:hypothetical protein
MQNELAQYGVQEARSEAEVRAILHQRGGHGEAEDRLPEGATGSGGAEEDARGYAALDEDDEPPLLAIAGDVARDIAIDGAEEVASLGKAAELLKVCKA